MQLLPFLYPALISLLLLEPALGARKNPKDAILLSNVKTLTLYADKKTSHRRVPAIPQLSCQGPGCKHYKIDIMRCTNQGSDYNAEDVQWSCTADLPAEFKLGSTEVICEGYDSADDERVLKGSCGVEYRLLLTEKGEERYESTWWGGSRDKGKATMDKVEEGSMLGSVLFMLVFAGVAMWILYSIYQAYLTAPRTPRQPRRHGGGGFGGWGGGPGGGGGGPWDDPPPPYPGKWFYGEQQGWRPGFWSGALGGAAAGYAAGSMANRRQEPVVQERGSGWFGGGGGGSSRQRGSRGESSSSGSSTRYESTGFGSTSRR